ncbi:MAG: cell division protein ZipA C-terminal FtsZ-binding domain-containing protein [Cycloclasticus sp.]|nr:cell division protein ZipA C-terminal FtsZ-binding domain-containing protein [Cycloclasticus sp.]
MEENSLRLILLLVGVVILMGIYFYDVLQKKKVIKAEEFDDSSFSERVDPVMENEPSFSAVFEDQHASNFEKNIEPVEPDFSPTVMVEDVPVAEQALVIQLVVLPKEGGSLPGTALLDAFTTLNLEYGDMGIFHCYERHDGVEIQQFHVANILEPGTFPVGSMAEFESTGIILFFQTSDVANPGEAFENMLNVARELSQRLDASLVDAEMNELMPDKIMSIESQLANLSRL